MSSTKHIILAEKPSAAKKIAYAIKDAERGELKTLRFGTVPIYQIKSQSKEIYVLAAVGHVFGLKAKDKSFTYPVFDVEWKPTFEIDKGASYVKPYYKALEKYGKNADQYIVATDFDIEGETIAYNILRYIFNTTNAKRMKFSTLTKKDLISAYEQPIANILYNVAEAGETRHIVDFYFGINLSRSLMLAMKAAGKFKVMSIGRVQGPALAILAEREKEIKEFKPTPYWVLSAELEQNIKAKYKEEKILDKEKANAIFEKIKNEKFAIVKEVSLKEKNLLPPTPFNLTDLQTEAYATLGINPKETQEIAQKLYENALISYPRTSSQKLPSSLPLKHIIQNLGKLKDYEQASKHLLSKPYLKPREGKKEDDAHPAIYPTGEFSALSSLSKKELAVYELIVRRFLATFYEPAKRQYMSVKVLIKDEEFKFEAYKTLEKGWIEIYEKYLNLEESLSKIYEKGEQIKIKKITLEEKQTQPPKRYNQASIIKELEKRNLGTKATRAVVIDNLFKRGYIQGQKQIEVTELGMKVYEVMKKYLPKIISEKLTRTLEEHLELIEKGQLKKEKVLEEAKQELTEVLKEIKTKEKEIGKELLESEQQDIKKNSTLMPCPNCGSDMVIKKSRQGKRFLACSAYPKCNTTLPLPQTGTIKTTNKKCEICSYPIIRIYKYSNKKRTNYETCLNPSCENHYLNKFNKVEQNAQKNK